ncbi:MAG TPA: hypothetical protein VLU43_15455 [Anaeromyxobacteraceae bacterium]|nr:hypothetical protein [Anaeromyxobacteraceae bacterium]
MTHTHAGARRRAAPRRGGLAAVAVLALAAFGCTVIRVPVSQLGDPSADVRGAIAAPQVELWLESGGDVAPAESQRAFEEARAALAAALARRGTPAPADESEVVLYVRERAVVRTASRKNDQVWGAVGIAVGAVIAVAVVVVAIVAGKGSGGSVPHVAPAPHTAGGAPGTAVAAGAATAARPAPVGIPGSAPGVAPRPAPVVPGGIASRPPPVVPGGMASPPAPVARPRPMPQPGGGYSGGGAAVAVELNVPLGPVEPAVAYVDPGVPPPEPVAEPWPDEEVAAPDVAPPPVTPALPPPAPLAWEKRGFFSGDEIVLDLVLVERRTGRTIWQREIHESADPRDAEAVSRAVDDALRGVPAFAVTVPPA